MYWVVPKGLTTKTPATVVAAGPLFVIAIVRWPFEFRLGESDKLSDKVLWMLFDLAERAWVYRRLPWLTKRK